MKYTYEQLAKMIDHSLLHPTMTDRELEDGCRLAAKCGVASVCIKPCAVKRTVELLKGSGVLVGAVIGFPHGNSATESKRYETELACGDGAAEIDMVINIGKALGGDWEYVERDIKAVCDEAHRRGLGENLDGLRLREAGRWQLQLQGRVRARFEIDACQLLAARAT